MKTYRAKTGPFKEQTFYTAEEIEQMCSEELQNTNFLPSVPSPIRIDRFIEKRFKITPAYYDLPDGIMGFIEFGQNGVKGITISRGLAEENTKVAERRIKTTLAHEGGHGLLHTHLAVLGHASQSLFGSDFDANNPKILCRNDTVQGIQSLTDTRYVWYEYQANLVIGPLLLPRSLAMIALEPFLSEKRGLLEKQMLDRNRCDDAVRTLSETFDVNPVVAKIRLDTLFPPSKDGQLTL